MLSTLRLGRRGGENSSKEPSIHILLAKDLAYVPCTHASGSQPPVTQAPGDLMSSLKLHKHLYTYVQAPMYTHMRTVKQ